MNKFVFVWAFLIFGLMPKAQTFEVEVPYESLRASLNGEAVFPMHLINVSEQSVSLYIKRTVNAIPNDWTSSLCFTFCFSPAVDSIATTRDFGSGPLAPGDTAEVSLHVFTASEADSGNVEIKIGSLENQNEIQTFTFSVYATPDDVQDEISLAEQFVLEQNYPNPFNPTTTIKYSIPSLIAREPDLSGDRSNLSNNSQNRQIATNLILSNSRNDANVQLIVYDVLGREVATLVNKYQTPGNYAVQFDAARLPSGVYYYTLRSGGTVITKKMLLLK